MVCAGITLVRGQNVILNYENIYTSDGTLTSNRNVDLNNQTLTFNNVDGFVIQNTNSVTFSNLGSFEVNADTITFSEGVHTLTFDDSAITLSGTQINVTVSTNLTLDNTDIILTGYPNTRDDGTSSNVLCTDASGNLLSVQSVDFLDVALETQSGSQAIPNSATSLTVTLPTAYADTDYEIIYNVVNTIDVAPIVISSMVTNKTTTSFTVTFSASIPSANYIFEWLTMKVS